MVNSKKLLPESTPKPKAKKEELQLDEQPVSGMVQPLNYSTVKDLIALQQATKISVILQGSPNEPNNFVEFHKEFVSTFDFLGLWDHSSSLPISTCHPKLVTQNIPSHLRYIYEAN